MDNNVYFRLKNERTRLNLGQAVVAAQADVTVKTVGRWEKEIAIPCDKLALLIPLGFDTSYILTGERNQPFQTPEEKYLLDGFRELDQATRKRVLAFIFGGDSHTTSGVVTKNDNSGAGIQNNAKNVTQTINNAPTSNIKIGKQKGDIVSGDKTVKR